MIPISFELMLLCTTTKVAKNHFKNFALSIELMVPSSFYLLYNRCTAPPSFFILTYSPDPLIQQFMFPRAATQAGANSED